LYCRPVRRGCLLLRISWEVSLSSACWATHIHTHALGQPSISDRSSVTNGLFQGVWLTKVGQRRSYPSAGGARPWAGPRAASDLLMSIIRMLPYNCLFYTTDLGVRKHTHAHTQTDTHSLVNAYRKHKATIMACRTWCVSKQDTFTHWKSSSFAHLLISSVTILV